MTYVNLMTNDQMETLRQQIAVYTAISEQLVEMHKTLTAQQDLTGVKLGNIYCDPLMTCVGHKMISRQRWSPTPEQLEILERIFDEGNGNPRKQKIKEIAAELSKHGQISETKVTIWFQNRRARSKRKQQNVVPNNTQAESSKDKKKNKKTKPKELPQSQHSEDDFELQPQLCSDLHYLNPESMFPSDGNLQPSTSFAQMSV